MQEFLQVCSLIKPRGIALSDWRIFGMPPIEFADSVEIRRRDILAAAAVGLAFGTSSLDALGQETTE
jgi:hypothetical protein